MPRDTDLHTVAIPLSSRDPSAGEWQRLIETGEVWRVAPSMGRLAAALIDAGICFRRD